MAAGSGKLKLMHDCWFWKAEYSLLALAKLQLVEAAKLPVRMRPKPAAFDIVCVAWPACASRGARGCFWTPPFRR